MKNLFLLVVLGLASAITLPANAQISVNINIGAQPQWGPRGYNYVDYYYLPDVETYYHVPSKVFIYQSGNRWVRTRHLPDRYRGYDLYRGRKVVINSPNPYQHHSSYKVKYAKYKNDKYKHKDENRFGKYHGKSSKGKKHENRRGRH